MDEYRLASLVAQDSPPLYAIGKIKLTLEGHLDIADQVIAHFGPHAITSLCLRKQDRSDATFEDVDREGEAFGKFCDLLAHSPSLQHLHFSHSPYDETDF